MPGKNKKLNPTCFILIPALVLMVVSCVYAWAQHRPFMYDGPLWYFHVLSRGFYTDANYLRLSTLIFELPVNILKILRPDISVRILITTLDFMFVFHPFISLLVCWKILRDRARMELFLFPLLSYSVATLPTISFAVGIVPESLTIFWPLLLYSELNDKPNRRQTLFILLMTLFLSFSYELAMLMLVLLAYARLTKIESAESKLKDIILISFGLGILFCLYRILGPHAGSTTFFWQSLRAPLYEIRKYTIFVISFVISCLYFPKLWQSNPIRYLLFTAFTLISAIFLVEFFHGEINLLSGYNSRVTAIPVAVLIGGLFLHSARKKQGTSKPRIKIAWMIVSISLLVGSAYDFIFTSYWVPELNYLQNEINKQHGCLILKSPEHLVNFKWVTPYTSILLQESRNINVIAFAADEETDRNQCRAFKDGSMDQNFKIGTQDYFNFSPILESEKAK